MCVIVPFQCIMSCTCVIVLLENKMMCVMVLFQHKLMCVILLFQYKMMCVIVNVSGTCDLNYVCSPMKTSQLTER